MYAFNLFIFSLFLRQMMYPIFDVYNNAYRNGGLLNVTLDRYYMVENGSSSGSLSASIHHRKTKYENRANMSDIAVRVSTVVRVTQLF